MWRAIKADRGTPNILCKGNQIGIVARRNGGEHISTPIHGRHDDVRRAHSVGKLDQHARPEIIVEHGLVDQVD
jgi:hypothetical protein